MGKHATTAPSGEPSALLTKAVKLFEFLGQVQQLKSVVVRTTDTYQRDGSVVWFGDLPEHRAVRSTHVVGDVEVGAPLLSVDRVPQPAVPEPDETLRAFLVGKVDQAGNQPTIRTSVPVNALPTSAKAAVGDLEEVTLADLPGMEAKRDQWLAGWQSWSAQELLDSPARDLYTSLFSTHLAAANHSEELEFVLGIGLLSWNPGDGHPAVSRHLFTLPVEIRFDEQTGRLDVGTSDGFEPLTLELDMVDPGLIQNAQAVSEIRERASEFEHHPFRREESQQLIQRLVHVLDAQGEYFDEDKLYPPASHPRAAFAPALILRKRSQRGLVAIFQAIVTQLQLAGEVPAGLLPLIDPDRQPSAEVDSTPGGIVVVDEEPFLPLPVNAQQLQVIRKVDSSAQVLVQGPPGTGKTHTAAALLSHLLAQGKRVLVTAQTDRALIEVRSKLPHAIKPLSVSIVGSSRSDMSDLKFAVEQISSRASAHDPAASGRDIDDALAQIDELRRERAAVFRELLDARQSETDQHAVNGREGTLAKIALDYQGSAARYDWIHGFVDVVAGTKAPIADQQALDLLSLLCDQALINDESESRLRLPEPASLPSPAEFAQACAGAGDARAVSDSLGEFQQHKAFEAIKALPPNDRVDFQRRLKEIALEASELEGRHEAWMNGALHDVRIGKATLWADRAHQIDALVAEARPNIQAVGLTTDVTVGLGDRGALVAVAESLRGHLVGGGKLKTSPAGQPQIGAFANKIVKESALLFDAVRVNHLPPTTLEALEKFIAHMRADDVLNKMDKAWPADLAIPEEDTLHERLQWHVTECSLLRRVLALADRLIEEEKHLQAAGVQPPDWTDLAAITWYASIIDAAAAEDRARSSAQPLEALQAKLATDLQLPGFGTVAQSLNDAVVVRNPADYASAHDRLVRLHAVRADVARRDELAASLQVAAPGLLRAVESDPQDANWSERLGQLDAAWQWSATGAWIAGQDSVDVNKLQAELSHIEGRIRGKVEHLAAARAWDHAVAPGRLTGRAQADLAQYAQLVKGYGKGTGKYAAQRLGEIRRSMDRCRPAVPVWIMPIYRIAEQLSITPNMFDVVIVDEASQAGLEATFLQYLAPKIVVIGDDKQVSPAAVGVNQQPIIDLANQYLAGDPYKASWQDPKRSLFDEASMRYGGRITLTEHRRCMPEIIGFSNRIAYEPDGVRLVPVRQFGADRLEPVKAVHIVDGYEKGSTNKVNPAEVDAIVAQIEDCLADPRYDGRTMGVISLLGISQAKAIEKVLLERIDPEEWRTRDLRCGDAAEFQGSERDVMFLSMVKAVEPEGRLGALTQELYVQRYNVAASRAKDQMWLFHSVTLNDVANPQDMRFALLDYVYGVANQTQTAEGMAMGSVPDDVRVEPFDSLFEQRVCNKIVDRGFVVVPQFEASGYRIDLVIIGARGRLAIECDGDAWHGPASYEADLARQRDLERCGWQFFRIRESAYYVDPVGELAKLWSTLEELGIHPSGWDDEELSGESGEGVESVDEVEAPVSAPAPAIEAVESVELKPMSSAPVIAVEPLSWHDEFAEDEVEDRPSVESSDVVLPEADLPFSWEPVGGPATAGIEAYRVPDFPVPAVLTGSPESVRQAILRIVEVEGPVTGARLQRSYVHASGGQRVGKQIAGELNRHITALARSGQLIAENPTGESGVKPRTFRLAGQPEFRIRALGPRVFDEVPPSELTALLTQVAGDLSEGWNNSEALYRGVLSRLGLVRMTTGVQAKLDEAFGLAETEHIGEL